jgi:hypothetical protein
MRDVVQSGDYERASRMVGVCAAAELRKPFGHQWLVEMV